MERFTISLDEDLAQEFDRLIAERGYQNRSEAVRDLLRGELESYRRKRNDAKYCVANLSYVYSQQERTLAERLTQLQHDNHDLMVSSMRAHLDHENCIESVLLRGPAAAVRTFAETLAAERGVRHGLLNMVSLEVDSHSHVHAHAEQGSAPASRHKHLKPNL